MIYRLEGASWNLSLSQSSLELMNGYRQLRFYQTEAGGQLFSPNPEAGTVLVELATPPKPTDKRSRTGFRFDPSAALAERQRLFESGLHCVGIWHTHPEGTPKPSSDDLLTTMAFAQECRELSGFLHIIIGTERMWVGLHDKKEIHELIREQP